MGRKHIKRLTVGGFQVFENPVTFPMGPLTLIYGPNSAGKSAILDAMLALADLCDDWVPRSSSTASHKPQTVDVLRRHWRRQGVAPAAPAEVLELGASIRMRGDEWAETGFATREFGPWGDLVPKNAEFASCFPILQPLMASRHLDLEVSVRYKRSERSAPGALPISHDLFAKEKRIEIGLSGAPILRFYQAHGLVCINLDHDVLDAWSAVADLRLIAPDHEDAFVVHGGWLGLRLSGYSHDCLSTNAVDLIEHLLSADLIERVRAAEASFINMFDALFVASLKCARDVLRVPVVDASRTVPRTEEVTFLFNLGANPISGDQVGLRIEGRPEYLGITREAFASEMVRQGLTERATWLFGEEIPRLAKNPLDLVNRLLGDYLFRSAGYFVAAGVHELIPLGIGDLDRDAPNIKDVPRKFLASLELCDPAGRRFRFDEVGSGLGYVLPVLFTVSTSDVAFVQQPELHLHPALQSELADALVAALSDSAFGGASAEGCTQIIAETHSEHLLLRLLRRVRQAADPGRSLDPHSLGREDFVVLYVDPKPDGTSTVKHLRIAKDGEFIDRWPRGFFEERWTELFDE